MDIHSAIKFIRNLLFKKKNALYAFLALIIFTIDRVSKIKVLNHFNESTYFVNNFINLDLIWNTGIGFGFLSTGSTLIYNIVTLVIGLVILFLIYIFLISEILEKLIYTVIIGGAFGNFYDRTLYKGVPDFIDLHYKNFHWFTFNIADIFITIGLIALLTNGFKKNK